MVDVAMTGLVITDCQRHVAQTRIGSQLPVVNGNLRRGDVLMFCIDRL